MIHRMGLPILLVLLVAARSSGQTRPVGYRISGKTVSSITGQVLPGVEVWITKAGQFDPTAQIQKLLTGEDGVFAFAGLEPGKYELAGQRNGYRRQGYEQHGMYLSAVVVGPGINSENLVFRLRPDARIVGTITDGDREPVPGAQIYLFRADASGGLTQTYLVGQTLSDDRGYYRLSHLEPGSYFLVVSAEPWFTAFARQGGDEDEDGISLRAEKAALDAAFPITFYPGVTDAASASPVAVNDAEEFTADFTLTAIPALRLRLDHFNANPEQPKSASLKQRVFSIAVAPPAQQQVPVGDSLEVRGVPPGRYVLDIESYGPKPVTRSRVIHLAADTDLAADGALPLPAISGVIRMDGGLELRPQAFVRLWNSRTHDVLDTQINPSGEFSFDPDFPPSGSYSVFAFNGPYSIISGLTAEGAQVVGQSIQITGSRPVKLSVVLSTTLSTINGIARRDGQPFPGAMVLLVPENPEINLPLFRRDQSDSDGTFTLLDVLPGRYRILAIENGWDMEWAKPALLKVRLDRAESLEVQPNKTYQTAVNVE